MFIYVFLASTSYQGIFCCKVVEHILKVLEFCFCHTGQPRFLSYIFTFYNMKWCFDVYSFIKHIQIAAK